MKLSQAKTFDFFIFIFSFIALFFAIGLAVFYANEDNPLDVPFLLRHDTYDKVFPFLLGTVAVGGFALVYSRVQRSKETVLAQSRMAKTALDNRIQRLQGIYETVLSLFQSVKLQRRRLRGAFIFEQENASWKIRRRLFEEVSMALNEAQLAGERVVKTFDFEYDALKGESTSAENEVERLRKLQNDLKSQIGGIQGILRNVLKTSELQSITKGTCNDEDLIDVPEGFVKFADPNTSSGNLGFRHIGDHFDAFAINIIKRIRELESESNSLGSCLETHLPAPKLEILKTKLIG
ncbi:MAG: hypothetical protein ACXV2C_06495 [Candidatus Bathyarchaeia archaeon]